ncbi:putative secreted protein (Por secretion system target) [Xanthomarina spongicola]|uniref:Putative secreted protein (Por secretion system target) n=2 Tax=Xanthomarina spongicola TaxID=570520 RepID=A0A316DUC6_9FLAO|nr:putative secreted protein (Por secretion system target) [Xanthomarina spongicola]
MKKITLKFMILTFFCMPVFLLAQEKQKAPKKQINLELTEENQRHLEETGFIRCATVEVEALRRQNDPSIQSEEEFENWLAPLIEARKQRIAEEKANGTFRRIEYNIPIIFHVITGSAGDAYDLSEAQIQAQIDQLNIDFRNLAGSTHAAAADSEINFIPATVDPNGIALTEPGINRVYGYTGTQSQSSMDGTVKPATIWDRSLYANVWTANLGGGLLGYAQFPSNSTLPGMPGSGGSAQTDGVVVLAGTVGSVANPGTAAPYNLGRTLTHEIGHWIGLRHIWGDGGCTVDDYCADTPNAGGANFGCPSVDSCAGGDVDMVENYMDYTDDACMDIFTNDQVGRMVTALENATGLSSLPSSPTGNPVTVYDLDGRIKINNLNLVDCEYTITPEIELINTGNNPITSITISYDIDGNTPTDYFWSGNLANTGDSEVINLPTTSSTSGSHTFNVNITSPNGGTDMNVVNDVDSENFDFGTSFMGSTSIELELVTDDYGSETTWEFTNSSGTVLYGSGSLSSNTTYNESFTIEDNECYTFTIYDSYGDGICCDYGTGSYELSDNTGTIIFTGAEFAAEEATTISTASLSTSEFELSTSLSIYPNPTSQVLNIKSTNTNLPDAYAIYNMLGQEIMSNKISNESDLSINTSNLSNGMYFIKIAKESNQVSLPFIKK